MPDRIKQIKQQRPGYSAALRKNRKILNKRLRALELETDLLSGQKNMYNRSTGKISEVIKTVKKANWWKRFLYSFTGDIKTLTLKEK